jgi:hypothetical protein
MSEDVNRARRRVLVARLRYEGVNPDLLASDFSQSQDLAPAGP